MRRALLVLLLAPSPALADDAAPVFLHLGPDGRGHEVDAALGVLMPTEDDDVLYRLALAGQGVHPRSGFGGYGAIALSRWSTGGDSSSAVGALELGGLFHRTVSPQLDTTIRVGVSLPTASQDGVAHYLTTVIAQPSDLVTTAPDATVLRAAVTPIYRDGRLHARADVGLDMFVFGPVDPPASYVHASFGFGAAAQPVGAALELQTLCSTDTDVMDRCVHLVAASGQLDAGSGVAVLGVSRQLGMSEDALDVLTVEAGFHARF